MIGSISKVRPLGHSHYFKYYNCVNNNDIISIDADYKNDIKGEGNWEYALESLTTLNTNAFNNSKITKFKAETPKLAVANQMFGTNGTTRLTELKMDFNNLTGCQYLFAYSKLSEYPKNFNPKTTTFTHLFSNGALESMAAGEGNATVPFYEAINNGTTLNYTFYSNKGVIYDDNYSFPNATNVQMLFGYNNFATCPPNLSFKNVVTFNNAFDTNPNLTSFQTHDEMSKMTNAGNAFTQCTSLKQLYPDYESFSFPKLNDAYNMFYNCQLDKPSVIKLCNALPTYTDGKSHRIGIGIHVDLKCDKDIQYKLRELSSAYTPTLTLDTEPESYKGWTITIQWTQTNTKNEVINPEKIAKLELDSITLPYGYRRCEYLESDTNNQYIDTEIIPTNTTGAWIIAKRITDTVDGFHLASRTNSNYYYPPALRSSGNYHGWGTTTGWTNFTKQNTAFESYINYPINGTITKEAVAIDNVGTSVAKALTTDLPTISHSLYMFGRNYNGTLESPWNGRIYRAKISEGDQINRDFIPALDPDGKPCMYEMIEGKPYYNAATSGDDFLYKVYEDYVMPEIDLTTLNIVEGSDYIPDASGWNEIATAKLAEAGEKIVRVVNGIAHNE